MERSIFQAESKAIIWQALAQCPESTMDFSILLKLQSHVGYPSNFNEKG